MQIFPFFHNLALLTFWEIVIIITDWTELDNTKPYYDLLS